MLQPEFALAADIGLEEPLRAEAFRRGGNAGPRAPSAPGFQRCDDLPDGLQAGSAMQVLQRADVTANNRLAGFDAPVAPVHGPEPRCRCRVPRILHAATGILVKPLPAASGANTYTPPAAAIRAAMSRCACIASAAVMPFDVEKVRERRHRCDPARPSIRTRPGAGRASAAKALTARSGERFDASSNDHRGDLPLIATASGPNRPARSAARRTGARDRP